MRVFTSAADIAAAVGEELGVSDWLTITQERVNTFADATGDHQWIHVDAERATRESPFGGPIAHGYLSLSLLPMLGWQIYTVKGTKMGINYGSNKVRFPTPVPVGARGAATRPAHQRRPTPRRFAADGGAQHPGGQRQRQASCRCRDRVSIGFLTSPKNRSWCPQQSCGVAGSTPSGLDRTRHPLARTSLNGAVWSSRGSRGKPRTRSARMLR